MFLLMELLKKVVAALLIYYSSKQWKKHNTFLCFTKKKKKEDNWLQVNNVKFIFCVTVYMYNTTCVSKFYINIIASAELECILNPKIYF
jgi:hypothetical protein